MSKNLVNSSDINIATNGDDISLELNESYYTESEIDTLLLSKVNTESGKGLSTNDFSDTYKNKINGIESGAEVNIIETVKVNGTALTPTNKAVNIDISGKANVSDVYNKTTSDSRYIQDSNYVHTDNNYTTTDKTKLAGIESGAEVNVIDKVLVNGIEQTITNKAVDIKVENSTIYGIKRSLTTSSSAWERTDNAVGLVANATKDGGTVQNDFDSIYPWSDIITYNYDTTNKVITAYLGDTNFAFDGSNGEVLTRIPEFYYKRYRDEDYEYIQISKYAIEGFTKSPAFSVGRYDTSYDGSKAHSVSGAVPEVQRSIVSFRTISRAVGEGFGQLDYHYFLLQMLYLVEYADYNSQSKLGNGITSMRYNNNDKALVNETSVNRIIVSTSVANNFLIGQQVSIGTSSADNWSVAKYRTITSKEDYDDGSVTGTAIYFDGNAVNIAVGNVIWSHGQKAGHCDSLGMKSGCLSNDGKHGMIYRGIENLLGNVFQWIDGINIKDYQAYICYSPEEYVSDMFTSPYQALGYVNSSNSNSYAKELGYDENNPLIALTTETGGSSSTYMCDNYYSSTGNRVARVGGNYNNGTTAGLWYWNLTNTSSNTYYYYGSRLLRYQD